MTAAATALCLRLYRTLASAFPHEFQMLYGEDLERLGVDTVPEVSRRYGTWGLVRLLADIALRLPVEYLAELRADARYALRTLAKSPGFTAVALVSLTIGIGVCSYFVNRFRVDVFRAVPGTQNVGTLAALDTVVPYSYLARYQEQPGVVAAAAFTDPVPFNLAGTAKGAGWNGAGSNGAGSNGAKTERLYGAIVSPEFFAVLGMRPLEGRFFDAESARAGSPPVVVVSERFWRSHFNADPEVAGRTVRLNGHVVTIVGVGPPAFLGIWPETPADLFVPLATGAAIAPELARNAQPEACHVVIRREAGVKSATLEARLNVVTERLDKEAKTRSASLHNERHVRFISLDGVAALSSRDRLAVYTFLGVLLGLVLTLACANLANLLLARSSQRRKEIAIRLSVGAGRFRLVRQLLTESLLLALAGGACGFGFCYLLTSLRDVNLRPDFAMLLFTLAVSIVTGVGFGLAPALATTRTDVYTTLKQGALTPLRGYRRFGLRNLLVVYQVAASLILLLITGLIVSGFNQTTRIDPGFDTSNLSFYQIDPLRDGYSEQQTSDLYRKLPDRLAKLSGVRSVTLADDSPVRVAIGTVPSDHFSAASSHGDVIRDGKLQAVSAGYFGTLGVAVVLGREFTRLDERPTSGALPAVINQAVADAFFGLDGPPGRGQDDPLGRTLRDEQRNFTVIGVVRDLKSGFVVTTPVPTVFMTLSAGVARQGVTLVVRGSGGGITSDIVNAISSVDPGLSVFNVGTADEQVRQLNVAARMASTIFGGIGVFGMILACIGLAGVTAYAVARRRKEIGIRMALGARGPQVLRLVMREGAVMVAVGSAIGIAIAAAVIRVLSALDSELDQVLRNGNSMLWLRAGAPLLLAALSLLACYLPARRLARVDPLASLREE